ncbi:B18 subunit of NADH:ubiquinone oxidoreductase, partial [Lentinula edodes]
MSPTTLATPEEMKAARLPLGWRDQCSALLIPLNICRRDKNFLPWECEHEKHAYEKC